MKRKLTVLILIGLSWVWLLAGCYGIWAFGQRYLWGEPCTSVCFAKEKCAVTKTVWGPILGMVVSILLTVSAALCAGL